MKKITVTSTGDSLITMRLSVHSEPEFLEMVKLIRKADVAFTNLEVLIHNYEENVYPAAKNGGTYVRADPFVIDELKWMGFNIVSTANNHSLDYMYGGLFKTIKNLKEKGLLYAGTGKNLAEARKPTYLETGKGRVGFISATSSFFDFAMAGEARRDMQGRPGLNPLRYEKYIVVKEKILHKLKKLEKEIRIPKVVQEKDKYHFLKNKFIVGTNLGVHTKPLTRDMKGNIEAIHEASRQADWVFFSLHAHEGKNNEKDKPAEFIEEFARASINAGAHAFIGHGYHGMRGIEILDEKPIFYSLGNFIFQNETVLKMPSDFYQRYKLDPHKGSPADAYDARQKAPPKPGYFKYKWFTEEEKWWITIIPLMTFEGDKIIDLKLYPIELGYKKPRAQRGRPLISKSNKSVEILNKIKNLSKPYGTKITIKNNVGIVKI